MKITRLVAVLTLGLTSACAYAQPRPAPPKLIVAISVDQLSADLFAEYRQLFTGGLRRLSEGAVFPAGFQSHAATETCPGHSTLLTGSRPSRTGIVANNWFDLGAARDDKYIYCAEDERVPGSTSESYTVSPVHLRVPTLGDLMRRANPRSRVVAVAGKDRAAVMMGGHNPNQRWWWGGERFVSHAGVAPSAAVTAANDGVARAVAAAREPMELPAQCAARSRTVAVGGRSVGESRFARAAGDVGAFRGSPDFDVSTLALADGIRRELRLGQGAATDLLAIGLSATDYVGHGRGTRGAEMCIQMLALDRLLGSFFAELDRAGIDYVVMLSADHGGLDLPERSAEQGIGDATRVDPALRVTTMGRAIGERLGIAGPVLFGDSVFGDIYLDRALSEADRRRAGDEAVRAYRAHPQVAAALTRAEIEATPSPTGPPDGWSLIQRARASYDPQRSGDIVVLLRPRVTPIADASRGSVATHGSPWDYDRRVPILFWRRGMIPFEQPLAIETVDIMPTLAALIGLPIPDGSIDGHCRDLQVGPESSCPR
jgi:predicted AlkP superfamily pyrophosphatase or phosphodiesterase